MFRATTVVDQELLESNIPVEQVGGEGDQASASDFLAAPQQRQGGLYAELGLDEEQPLEKVALHVYRMPNGTFRINDMVPTRTDFVAGQQRPSAPMTAEMGHTLLIQINQMK